MIQTPGEKKVIAWLLAGDVSIQYQVHRDLLGRDRNDLRRRIAAEGWGRRFLSKRHKEGHWGRGFYQTKWISSHYTLLDLKHLCIAPDHPQIRESIALILEKHREQDGGVNPARTIKHSDICVNGMFLNYAAYFRMPPKSLESIVDFLIANQMPDGGFNCESNQNGAVHSSLHSTISILEGIQEYASNGYQYRAARLRKIAAEAREFILEHRLFRSDKTGEVINPAFLRLSFPSRWFYDILRALEYFRSAGVPYDPRMQDALDVLIKKQREDGTWPLQARHAGQTHFEMEKPGQPSRWNTLRSLRVLKHFGLDEMKIPFQPGRTGKET